MMDNNHILNEEFRDLLFEDDVDDFVEIPKKIPRKRKYKEFKVKGVYVAS